MEPLSEAHEARDLVQRCLSGDQRAIQTFQERYGELIYGYPMRVYGTAAEEAAGFYVYAFENARIFRRSRTFEGRAPFRAYLLSYVLDHLVIDWKRAEREIETVSLETISELADGDGTTGRVEGRPLLMQVISEMSSSKALVMKLLYIEDCELAPSDIQYLAQVSRRRVREIVAAVDRLRATVREREANVRRIEDRLDTVHAWIQLYERRLQRIDHELRELRDLNGPLPDVAERLAEERAELQRKIQWRHEQRRSLLNRAQRRKVTTPYKDMATLLNISIGNVASQIARARRELAERLGKQNLIQEEDQGDATG